MDAVPLNNGQTMPPVGLGLWKVKDQALLTQAVRAAYEHGYRHFDTAQIYGNEAMLAEAIRLCGIAREDLFITTKIWLKNFLPSKVTRSFETSLKRLNTPYVDLLLLHYPLTVLRKGAWKQLEVLYGEGRARSIGVSNYTIRHLEELKKYSSVTPAINQVELHVFLQQPELLAYCKAEGITVQAYSPLAHGHGLDNEVLAGIASKHGVTTAQVMLRWCIEQGTVPLPKSTNPERIAQNIAIFGFTLDEKDMEQIASLEAGLRTCWDPTNTP